MEPENQRRIDQLTTALEHRTSIGIAIGILMERLDLSADDAFGYLRSLSSHQNRKLFVIAAEIADSRDIPIVP